jgi:hypothetical protein
VEGFGEEEDEGEGNGRGKGKGKGQGKGEGEGEGDGDGQGKGEGSGQGEGEGSGSGKGGKVSAGGGQGTGTGRGKSKFDEVSELPDPGEYTGSPLPNPAALEPRSAAIGGQGGNEDDPTVKALTQQLKKEEFDQALKKIGMTEFDANKYNKYVDAVKTEIRELRSIFDNLESKDQERIWYKNQQVGDLDDQKLIDGLTGDRSIYKRRKDADPDNPFFQPKPKKLSFVFDVSMSMSRYASDGRLERSLECAVMVMEALKGFERKFDYRIVGHSGDTDELQLVPWGKPPKNDKGRLDIIRAMHAHCEMCDSGDHTIEAAKKAIFDCAAQQEADDRFVFLVSDANLDQYSITPDMIGRLFELDKRVHVFMLFIASVRDSASAFARHMPGNVFICLDKKELPKVMKRMFLAAASKGY